MIVALNKADLLSSDIIHIAGIATELPSVRVSALNGDGTDELLRCISDNLVLQFDALDVVIPYERGELVAQFHQFGTIEEECYEANGTHIRGHMPKNHSGPLLAFQQQPTKSLRA